MQHNEIARKCINDKQSIISLVVVVTYFYFKFDYGHGGVYVHEGRILFKDMEVSTYMKDGMIDNWDMFEKVLDYSYKMIIQEFIILILVN